MDTIIKSNTPAMSEDIRAIAQAFLLAKQEFLVTGRSGKADRYKYAKIEDIYHAVEDALAKNNIIIWHFARPEGGVEYLYTRLIHTLTGQYIEDCRMMESEKPGNQAKGSANTYMKRYALLSLCAIPTEDDDAQGEQKYIDEPRISPEEVININKVLSACSNGDKLRQDIMQYNKVRDISDLRVSQYERVKDFIIKNRK